MSQVRSAGRRRSLLCALMLIAASSSVSPRAFAQGCMPIRFTSPKLDAQRSDAQREGQWELGVVYRWLHANQFYIGHTYSPDSAPGGQPSRLNISTVELHLSYAPTSRFSVNLGVPLASGSSSQVESDGLRHADSQTGLGDVSLVGTIWVLDPPDHGNGNIAFGLGMKAPTGRHDAQSTFYLKAGTEQRNINPAIQLGDGGWGIAFETRAFRRVFRRTAAYAAASYLANVGGRTGATQVTKFGTFPVAATDEYSAHAGLTYDASPRRGLTMSLGWRIDGVPTRNLSGSSDTSFRRPGYASYVEPAWTLTLWKSPLSPTGNTLTLSVPLRVGQNREASVLEVAHGRHGGGDFGKFLVFLGFTKPF